MKSINKKLTKICFTIFSLVLPVLAFANNHTELNETSKIKNPLKSNTIAELVEKVLEGAIKIGLPLLVLAIIYSGFLFVSAQGNSEKLNEAKQTLLYTLVGSAILLGAWAIAQLISETITSL